MKQSPRGKWIDGIAADTPVAVAAELVLSTRLEAVRHYLPLAALRAEEDVEYVHQLRVATRRVAAALSIFEPVIKRQKPLDKAKKALRSIRRAAAVARQCDVHTMELATRHRDTPPKQQPVIEEVIAMLARRRQQAQKDIVRADEKFSQRKLTKREAKLVRAIDDKGKLGRKPYTQLAARKLPKLVDAFEVRAAKLAEYEDLHWLRIEGKRLRYALEAFAPCLGDSFKEVYPGFKELQDGLGEVNDLHEIAALLQEYVVLVEQEAPELQRPRAAKLNRGEHLDEARKLVAEHQQQRDARAASFVERWHKGEWTNVLRWLDEWAGRTSTPLTDESIDITVMPQSVPTPDASPAP